MKYFIIAAAVIVAALVIVLLIRRKAPWERAGRRGERRAVRQIERILNADDALLNNIEFEHPRAEFDNIIINKRGVFIIEVKAYVGELSGRETDETWLKVKTTKAGNTYEERIKNPITQVKREIEILGRVLKEPVKGYVYFVNENAPFKSRYVVQSMRELSRLIHSGEKRLETAEIRGIIKKLR